MEGRSELGRFLRSRRGRLRPEDVGLVDYGGRRRVPGLRREELAQLAGVSAGYYTRLEQGQSLNASDAVLGALARVLRLDEDERAHLYSLARRKAAGAVSSRPGVERVRPGVRQMVASFGDVPALVIGRCGDVLLWNRMAHALLAGHLDVRAPEQLPERPNVARLVFLDPHTRELYADWWQKARDTVADLRQTAGRYPDDPRLTALIGELTVRSPEFASLWAAHAVRPCAQRFTRDFRHPLVGPLRLTNELMELTSDHGQRVAVFNAEPGSSSEAALLLLSDMTDGGLSAVPSAPRRADIG
ncbi:helix-turn-helix transcriptional regulator [Streptomyces sp. WMMC500]|uniref:helix-turn-helix transcriptional regulator n=1 Tax=Streptomyces sp. WMMC500 TaxID=3015154 RepID=UPI00248B4A2D|nr:helix-turn-helix transcriptional regulator [Streptomyces sp. WMMC500]WBB58059.1 helix-turn-helix transcriptional regulator [Streptomyces sp. WMMC500]